jgi:hypothetical protein
MMMNLLKSYQQLNLLDWIINMTCSGKLPIELSSSINAISIPCPWKDKCGLFSKKSKTVVDIYYNRFNKQCKTFKEK